MAAETNPRDAAHQQDWRLTMWKLRKLVRSLDNWRRGFAFGYVRRCRDCGHTAYYPDHCGRA